MFFREKDIIFDPEPEVLEDIAKKEATIRPSAPGTVQLQMNELDDYLVFLYPNEMKEFSDPDAMRRFLDRRIGDPDLVERGLSMMANYKLVNIDVNFKTIDIVRKARKYLYR